MTMPLLVPHFMAAQSSHSSSQFISEQSPQMKLTPLSSQKTAWEDTRSARRAYRAMTLTDAIVPHDVEDAHANSIPIAPSAGQPRQAQPGEQSALRIRAFPGLREDASTHRWSSVLEADPGKRSRHPSI